MIPQKFRHAFDELYEARLKRHKSGTLPPWAVRKSQDIARSLAHPDIYRDLVILMCCTHESVLANHTLLIKYFISTYGMSDEMAESWVLYFATGDVEAIVATKQLDGVRYFNDDLQIAGPASDEKEAYARLLRVRDEQAPHVNIRIGASATRSDVKWFIDKYWESDIEPHLSKVEVKQTRNKKLLRNSTIYALHKQGLKAKAIQDYIDDTANYGEFVELSTISNIIKGFKPPHDWFAEAYEVLRKELRKDNKLATFIIGFTKEPKPHFTLDLVKDK